MDFRVSVLPTIWGEKVVMRLLDKGNLQLDMAKLGFDPKPLEDFNWAIHQPWGMVLVTGPTGSGKTTTLYSALSDLNKPGHNISTAEDPVEYNLHGINQVQMHDEIGLNFAMALRAFLRQDPDIIMVGEVRDFETAEIAVKAALTGHLVLSTLHTNDTSQAVSRILDSFPQSNQPQIRQQLSLALLAVVAQQLVPSTGNGDRYPVVEILKATSGIRSLIRKGEDHQLYSALSTGRSEGMISMEQSLAEMVRSGRIHRETAMAHCFRPEDLARYLQT
jgi:pilus retraction protein PilT